MDRWTHRWIGGLIDTDTHSPSSSSFVDEYPPDARIFLSMVKEGLHDLKVAVVLDGCDDIGAVECRWVIEYVC